MEYKELIARTFKETHVFTGYEEIDNICNFTVIIFLFQFIIVSMFILLRTEDMMLPINVSQLVFF